MVITAAMPGATAPLTWPVTARGRAPVPVRSRRGSPGAPIGRIGGAGAGLEGPSLTTGAPARGVVDAPAAASAGRLLVRGASGSRGGRGSATRSGPGRGRTGPAALELSTSGRWRGVIGAALMGWMGRVCSATKPCCSGLTHLAPSSVLPYTSIFPPAPVALVRLARAGTVA
eukprot:4891984-Amphidinium_carterae.1